MDRLARFVDLIKPSKSKILFLFLLFLMLATTNLVFEILPRPTNAQRLALEKMQLPPNLGKKNALAAMYFFPYNVAPDKIESHFAQELILMQRAALEGSMASYAKTYDVRLAKKFGRIGVAVSSPVLCKRGEACLKKVRANLSETIHALEGVAPWIDRLSTLRSFDYFSAATLPYSVDTPFPYFNSEPALTAAGLKAIQGDTNGAVNDVCFFAQTVRRLGNSDSLIAKMVSFAYLRRSVELLREIQTEFPDPVIPKSCAETLMPLRSAELDLCPALRNEWLSSNALIVNLEQGNLDPAHPDKWTAKMLEKLTINVPHTRALFADTYASYCLSPAITEAYRAAERARTPICGLFAYVGNPVGCMLATYSVVNFTPYPNRAQDADNTLRLFQLAQFAASSAAKSCSKNLSCAPREIVPTQFSVDAKLRTVSIDFLVPQDDRKSLIFRY
jgi:hypothetical protein